MFLSRLYLWFCLIFMSFFSIIRANDLQQSLQYFVSQQIAEKTLSIKPTALLRNSSKGVLLYDLGGCDQDPRFTHPLATSFRAQCTVEMIRAYNASSWPSFQKYRPQIIKEAESIISEMLQATELQRDNQNDLSIFLNQQQSKLNQMYQQKMDMIAHEEGWSKATPASLMYVGSELVEVYFEGAPPLEFTVKLVTIPSGGVIQYLPQILEDFNEFVLRRNVQNQNPPYPPITVIQSDQVSLLGGKYWFFVSWPEGSKTIKNSDIHSNQAIEFRKD